MTRVLKITIDLLLVTLLILFFDAGYLYFNSGSFSSMITSIQHTTMEIRLWPVVICYAFIVTGIYYFIIRERKSVSDAILLGVVIYAVYDCTNYATLTNYSISFAIMDAIWGGALFGLVTFSYQLLID